ncbi:MAG: SpoIID/LytB domain-containing protein [Calditrichaeota bacterium]|nr:SpoIID/LytB domain-containing protein [Calditrichota bacterium]
MVLKYISIFIIAIIVIFACAPPPQYEEKYFPQEKREPETMPLIRIGLAEGLESLQFEIDGKVEILDRSRKIASRLAWNQPYRIDVANAREAKMIYRLRVREFSDRRKAYRLADSLRSLNLPVAIVSRKARLFRKGRLKVASLYSVVIDKKFPDADKAYRYQWTIRDKVTAVAVQFINAPASGEIFLTNLKTGEKFHASRVMILRGDIFSLELPTAEGFHFEEKQKRRYHSRLEFVVDRFGKLTVINVIPLETYLKGVVGSEMQEKFPLEALKAQAVAARCYTLARLGKQHPLAPFDVCDEVHCHVYGGIDRESPRVTQAVNETAGQILVYKNQICETFYAGVCGGHTENNEYVWNGEPHPYLQGHLDAENIRLPRAYLQNEKNVRRWIESQPRVFCNTQTNEVPDFLEYTKKYFRWQVRYSQRELSRIIEKKSGQKIGLVTQIVPILRGVSGRLYEIEIRGTRGKITVDNELQIRRTLSENYLYSSCFVVDREGSDFIIKGAGWGHGVGMCQTGAAMMALKGKNYKEVLNHYYPYTKLVKFY